jgi:hypothetical protein
MAGNFRGVLIVIIVVDLQSQNFHPRKINAYIINEGRGQKHHGSAANFLSNNHYCHPIDGIFVTNIILSHAICLSFFTEMA